MMTLLKMTHMRNLVDNREKRFVKEFKQPVSKLYAMLFLSVIPIFHCFNNFLQAEDPLIHILYHFTLRLYCSLRSRFFLFEVISESGDVLSIDIEDPDVLKDFNCIFVGAMTKQYARGSDIIGTSECNSVDIFSSAWKTSSFGR